MLNHICLGINVLNRSMTMTTCAQITKQSVWKGPAAAQRRIRKPSVAVQLKRQFAVMTIFTVAQVAGIVTSSKVIKTFWKKSNHSCILVRNFPSVLLRLQFS